MLRHAFVLGLGVRLLVLVLSKAGLLAEALFYVWHTLVVTGQVERG